MSKGKLMDNKIWSYEKGFRWASNRPWWMDYALSRFSWYRRWCGGHWELWWNDVTHSCMWDRLPECTQLEHNVVRGIRPPCCYGKPLCEEHK